MRLSIVTTLYGGARYLRDFHERCCTAAEGITDDFEILLVNDGSPDESLAIALELHEKDRRVRVIDLARNFGQHKALLTGLAHVRGELVFLLDSDLEEDPDWLRPFYERTRDLAEGIEHPKREVVRRQHGIRDIEAQPATGQPVCQDLEEQSLAHTRWTRDPDGTRGAVQGPVFEQRERALSVGSRQVVAGARGERKRNPVGRRRHIHPPMDSPRR